ncbi:hypothetical protein ACHAWF_010629 [Thalassiosira exigua]
MMLAATILFLWLICYACGLSPTTKAPPGVGAACVGPAFVATRPRSRDRRHRRSRSTPRLSMGKSFATSSSRVVASSPELGGDVIRIRTGPDEEDVDSGFLTALGVPTFAVCSSVDNKCGSDRDADSILGRKTEPKRLGLEGLIRNPNAFLLENALTTEACESILSLSENLGFGNYNAGKNNHGAMQICVSEETADALLRVIGPHVDMEGIASADKELDANGGADEDRDDRKNYALRGINRRFRIYRYAPNQNESFAPHIDAGFPPGGVSLDDDISHDGTPFLHWDASHQYSTTSEVVSRLTVLIYLNDDFSGGHTKFYEPLSERGDIDANGDVGTVVASIKPRAGSILVFPQAVSETSVERARRIWPLHEGSLVTSGNSKYVIRTDVLFETILSDEDNDLPPDDILFQHDDAVRNAFLNTSPIFSRLFLQHTQSLYNPHMVCIGSILACSFLFRSLFSCLTFDCR